MVKERASFQGERKSKGKVCSVLKEGGADITVIDVASQLSQEVIDVGRQAQEAQRGGSQAHNL